jgi:hypothetical protein
LFFFFPYLPLPLLAVAVAVVLLRLAFWNRVQRRTLALKVLHQLVRVHLPTKKLLPNK